MCAIYDVDDALGFLVMECIDGPTLKELLASGLPDANDVTRIATQLADALDAAHSLGIIHRDIKPANIMLTSSGDVKITDFGLAKTGDQSTLTLTGQVLGTPAYMSPEQVRGEKLGATTDMWSFGVVLYEMLTGVLPFGSGTLSSTLYRIVNEPPIAMIETDAGNSSEFRPIIDRCLAKAAADRYRSARSSVTARRSAMWNRCSRSSTECSRRQRKDWVSLPTRRS